MDPQPLLELGAGMGQFTQIVKHAPKKVMNRACLRISWT